MGSLFPQRLRRRHRLLILAGAANTAIVGSNGVLNRVARTASMPSWFLKPHGNTGLRTASSLIVVLQIDHHRDQRGNTLLLGEAVCLRRGLGFVFQALSMVVPPVQRSPAPGIQGAPQLRMARSRLPIGLGLVVLILLVTALVNLLTKGSGYVSAWRSPRSSLSCSWSPERYHHSAAGAASTSTWSNQRQATREITPASLD